MKALVVLAHPEPKSFNGQLAATAADALRAEGWEVSTSDLYAMGFDPVERAEFFPDRLDASRFDTQREQRKAFIDGTLPADVAAEIEKVESADLVVLQFPIWWFGVPAILKGWLERVYVSGLYTSRMRYDAGKFRGRRAMLSATGGGPADTFLHDGRNGDIDLLMWPMNFSLHYMGYDVVEPFTVFGVDVSSKVFPDEADGHLERMRERMRSIEKAPTVPFNGWDDWDASGRLRPDAPSYSPFMRSRP